MSGPSFHTSSDSQLHAFQQVTGEKSASPKGGRPRLSSQERRIHKYTVAVNAREKEMIEAKARRAGLSPSAYLREAGRGAKLGWRANRQVVYELSRMGVYLQAIGERREAVADSEALGEVLETIRRAIEEL